jgi:predicted nucleic-acid-binding protein
MKIVDANIILRYLLNDQAELFDKAVQIIDNNDVFVPFEVMAEVVYVLEKLYRVPRTDIRMSLEMLISYPNISFTNQEILLQAILLYKEKRIDFVDSLLIAYNHVENYKIYTFDKKLEKLLITD